MNEVVRETAVAMLAERTGAGRADLVLLMNPATRRTLLEQDGFDATPDRLTGILIEWTSDVEEGEFELSWREG